MTRALFIGRFQPPHKGHFDIIQEALDTGVGVAIGVRDTPLNEKNPYELATRIAILETTFQGADVVVFGMPDIASIHIGRDVGYQIVTHDEVPGISGTHLRMEAGLGAEDIDL